MIKPRPALFNWRHFEFEIIVCAVRWYLRVSLSYRDVEELLMERGIPADHTTIWRIAQRQMVVWTSRNCSWNEVSPLTTPPFGAALCARTEQEMPAGTET